MTFSDIKNLLDAKTILAGFIGAIIAILLNSVVKAWKYSKELNKYREIIVRFIEKVGIPLTDKFISEGNQTIEILQCKNYQEYKRLIANVKLDHFPMLNSDIFRSIPMTIMKDMLYQEDAFIEVFTFYHCLDFMMGLTPVKAYMENHDFVQSHLKEKKLAYHEDFVREFENCEVIATRRKFDCNRLRSRTGRAELNLTFLSDLRKELKGNRQLWQMKYFFKTFL